MGPGSKPWLLDLRSGFNQSKSMNGASEYLVLWANPLGHSHLPDRRSPSFIPSSGRLKEAAEKGSGQEQPLCVSCLQVP